MEYVECQKIINFWDNTANQPFKFKTKNWVEINDEWQGTYNEDNQIRFKTLMLKSSLCDYRHAYILVKGNITAINTAGQGQSNNGVNRKVIFKNCILLTA